MKNKRSAWDRYSWVNAAGPWVTKKKWETVHRADEIALRKKQELQRQSDQFENILYAEDKLFIYEIKYIWKFIEFVVKTSVWIIKFTYNTTEKYFFATPTEYKNLCNHYLNNYSLTPKEFFILLGKWGGSLFRIIKRVWSKLKFLIPDMTEEPKRVVKQLKRESLLKWEVM